MSRAKLFNMIKSRGAQPNGRNGFDLTNGHVYSMKAGVINPLKALHVIPADYMECVCDDFSQTLNPMNTAAFLRGSKELSAYFVPYNTVWHNFNQYMATREDPESAVLRDKGVAFEPRVALYTLYRVALDLYGVYLQVDTFSRLKALVEARELVDGDTSKDFETEQSRLWSQYTSEVFASPYQFFTDLYFSELFRMTDGEDDYGSFFFSRRGSSDPLTFGECGLSVVGQYVWCDWCRKLDMLGYGNIYPILKKLDDTIQEYYVQDYNHIALGHNTLSLSQLEAKYKAAVLKAANRLRNMSSSTSLAVSTVDRIHYYTWNDDADSADYTEHVLSAVHGEPVYVNAYALFAYNKIFYDMFRNVYFDTDYDVRNYNADFLDCNSLAGSVLWPYMLPPRFFQLENHQWKKDMFTGVLPDQQFGVVSSLSLGSVSLSNEFSFTGVGSGSDATINGSTNDPEYADGESVVRQVSSSVERGVTYELRSSSSGSLSRNLIGASVDYYPSRIETPHTHDISAQVSMSDLSISGSGQMTSSGDGSDITLNVMALRRAECLQQYRMDLERAGNRTRDIFQQVYGKSPKSQLDEAPYFIEVANNPITVNPIVATSETGQGSNGNLGDIAARAVTNGESLRFKFSSNDFGVIIFLSYIVPESMYNSYRVDPHLANLSQEDHFLPYFQNLGLEPVLGESLSNLGDASIRNRVIGYAPSYLEFKTDIDQVHGAFVDAFEVSNENYIDLDYEGSLHHWAVARTDMQLEKTTSLRNFYADPRVLDSIFAMAAGPDYETDQFICVCNIAVKAVRQLSELGLPRFC